MTIKREVKIVALYNFAILTIVSASLATYDFIQRKQIAHLVVEAQRNNLIARNIGATATTFSSLTTLFEGISLAENTSEKRLLGVDLASQWSSVEIAVPIRADEHAAFEITKVIFWYNPLDSLAIGLLIAAALGLLSTPGLIRFLRYADRQNHLRIQVESNERFNRTAVQVAHDIRAPVTALNMLSSTIKNDSGEGELIKAVAKRINAIADDLLQKSRSETAPVAFEPFRTLNSVLDEKRVIWGESVQLFIDWESELTAIQVHGNEIVFSRVLANVFQNSYEAKSNQRQLELNISAKLSAGFLKISVRDNGVGILPENIQQVGRRGFSSKKAESGSGTGLGVWSARETLAQWGSKLSITSAPEKGTEVILELKLAPA